MFSAVLQVHTTCSVRYWYRYPILMAINKDITKKKKCKFQYEIHVLKNEL